MNHFQGITTEIIANDRVLDLYDDPDAADIQESRSRHNYIEVVAGSTFQVEVNLTPEFDLSEMNAQHAVSIIVEVDGRHDSSLGIEFSKKELERKFSKEKTACIAFTGPRQFCQVARQWKLVDYCFGNLVSKEMSDSKIPVEQAKDIGKIQITIERVKLVKLRRAYVQGKEPLQTMNEIPEKALKGRPIETTVGFANARTADPPLRQTTVGKSIGGEAGKPIVFNIYYRSRRALQMLGCIPRSPSPESQVRNDESAPPADVVQEVRDLRARLALLERGINVKSEGSGATTRAKRERDEEGNEGSRQRRRTSVKVEHIDLTDD